MKTFKAFFALFKGLSFCFSNAKIRKLSLWPWLVGAVTYIAASVGAVYLHHPLLHALVDPPSGVLSYVWYGLLWLLVALLLLVATLICTVAIVMVFTGVFETAIAVETLRALGAPVPPEESGISATLKETGRTIATESIKLIWLLPLICISFLIGLIPFLTPFALLLGGWLLAYQFVDVVLDIRKISAGQRFRFALRHSVLLTAFGLSLVAVCLIPFVGLLIPPVAVSAAAWLLNETGLLPALPAPQPELKPDGDTADIQ